MERLTRMLLVTALGLSAAGAWADKPDKEDRYWREERQDGNDNRADRKERMQRIRKEMELRRTLKIADELGLQESDTLRIRDILHAADERDHQLQKLLRTEVKALRSMGDGSPSAAEVDGQLKKIADLRRQILAAEEKTLEEAARGLPPAKKARLAVILGVHGRAMTAMALKQLMKRQSRDNDGAGDDADLGF